MNDYLSNFVYEYDNIEREIVQCLYNYSEDYIISILQVFQKRKILTTYSITGWRMFFSSQILNKVKEQIMLDRFRCIKKLYLTMILDKYLKDFEIGIYLKIADNIPKRHIIIN